MSFLISTVEVEDYARWREVFDAGEAQRRQHGMNGGRVLRDSKDPNRVTVIIEGELSGIEQYGESAELKETMARAGVLGPPTVLFAEDVT